MRNKTVRSRVKSAVKNVRQAVTEESPEKAVKELDLAKSVIDKAAKKGAIHKRTAARKISRLSKIVNVASS
jgi:small subunit ribosomal protein S20